MRDMRQDGTALLVDEVHQTFSAVIVVTLDGARESAEEVAGLLRSLASRGVTVVVFDPSLVAALEEGSALSPGGRCLLVRENGGSVVELSEDGTRVVWTTGQGELVDAAQFVAAGLSSEGIGPGITLVLGNGMVSPGSPHIGTDKALGVLRDQITRIDSLRVPSVDIDPSWTMRFEAEETPLRVRETLCTLANGHIGTRGSGEEEPPGSDPLLVAAGVYDDQKSPSLLEGPRWTRLPLDLESADSDRWTLDLRCGLLARQRTMASGTLHTLRFVSMSRLGCAVLRAEAPSTMLDIDRLRAGGLVTDAGAAPYATASSSRGRIAAAATDRVEIRGGIHAVERIAAYEVWPGEGDVHHAMDSVRDLAVAGSDRLLAEHRAAWAKRWENAAVTIAGDPETELAVRFALFHLISSADTTGEAAVGARGLTGRAYRGHVFWDTDVYVLPALTAVLPDVARAIVEYRLSRLPAAREEAYLRGARGARFPWESADKGQEVTPQWYESPEGDKVPIKTGLHEEHIVADVAWSVRHYALWTGDQDFYLGPGGDLIIDTARYWASRIRIDAAGRGHLEGVIGPDEYHEIVDDNAFTNIMARANLRWAVDVADQRRDADPDEVSSWSDLATRIVDGFDEETRIYEQFAGYSELEPLLIEEMVSPPIAADILLGRAGVARTQLIKQADVLMLHHLIPDEVASDSLVPNLDYYLPRTAHGSSLSPAIHASLLARAGRADEALAWFRLAARLDLDDLTGTTARGIHLATMGGLWQALAFGFLGLRLTPDGVEVDPRIPGEWDGVEMSLLALGSPLKILARHGEVEIESGKPLTISCGRARTRLATCAARFTRRGHGWKEIS
jgi:trehalose/maltose hydrolase-like predicted phosphorylase